MLAHKGGPASTSSNLGELRGRSKIDLETYGLGLFMLEADSVDAEAKWSSRRVQSFR
jgi:hypothetical protein